MTLPLSALTLVLALATVAEPGPVLPALAAEPVAPADQVAHGGGCRKSSPPGQCCHMDRKKGAVHCH